MESPEQARKDQERAMKNRERVRFRVYNAVRDVMLGTALFRTNFQLHEPDITVNAYSQFIDVNASLNEAQLRLIPTDNRSRHLHQFAGELQDGITRIAARLNLELTTDPARFGGSGPVMLVNVPIGYRAVLLLHDRE
jgi:hypothetical protein